MEGEEENLISIYIVSDATSDSLTVEFIKTMDFDKIEIIINENLPIPNFKQVKTAYADNRDKSIKINGLCEYVRKAFCSGYYPAMENGKIVKAKDENEEEYIVYETHDCGQEFVRKILDKYKNGVTYVDAEWKGDPDLTLNNTIEAPLKNKFTAKSQYDDAEMTEVYECLSNEFKFSGNFRQRTKGRELWEGR